MAFPVAEVWTVSGTLNKGNVAFSEGKVYAYNSSSITNTNPNFIDSRISAEKKHLFEGRGADSIWSLSVTGASGNQITDVIIYLNYTARN